MPPQQQQQQPQGPPGPQMQPQGWGSQQGGGALDWRQILQAVTRSNPGAPPQVIASAVNRAIPLMNAQAQMEWKTVMAQMAGQKVDQGWARVGQGDERLGQGQARIDQRSAQIVQDVNMKRQQMGLQPLAPEQIFGGGVGGLGRDQGQPQASQDVGQTQPDTAKGSEQVGGLPPPQNPAEQMADDIYDRKRSPIIRGYGPGSVPARMQPAVEEAMQRRHPDFNQAQSILQWQGQAKLNQSVNAPQQVRFMQLENSAQNLIPRIEQITRQMNMSPIVAWNQAKLEAEEQAGNPTVARYNTLFAAIMGEVAQLEAGGYAAHDRAWTQASAQLKAARGVRAQLAALDEIKRIIRTRAEGMKSVAPGMTPGSPNPYAPGGGDAPSGQSQQSFEDRFSIAPVR